MNRFVLVTLTYFLLFKIAFRHKQKSLVVHVQIMNKGNIFVFCLYFVGSNFEYFIMIIKCSDLQRQDNVMLQVLLCTLDQHFYERKFHLGTLI